MAAGSSHPLQRLLDEASYVRALAAALAAADADDVAQTVWVRAIEHEASVARPRPWVAQVLRRVAHNLRRATRRRAAHELAAAHAEPVPSSAELMEREERRRDLVRAVDALPEPLRAVVLLRYFEDLPPRAIAARLGVPVTTVWNRQRTALATLRRKLEERHGDRRAFLLPLLPGAGSAVATGVFAVSAKGKLAGAAVLTVMALLSLWASGLLPSEPVSGPAPPQPAPQMTADVGQDDPAPAPAERTEVAPLAPSTVPATGTLLVFATYPQDGAPVPDLIVAVRPVGSESRFDWRRARTDERGLARILDLKAGEHEVCTERNWRTRARATVVAGAEQRVDLVLRAGIEIMGIVVDAHGVPVAGAEVHVAPALGQRADLRPAATTGDDGRFALRSCSERCAVGARAAGHAPSWMHYVNLQEGGRIDLRLELPGPGGVVEGTVFGPGGAPVADAAVVIGAGLADIVRTTTEGAPAPPAYVYTGADGRFRAVGVPPGDQPVQVRARGCGLWSGSCRVEPHAVVAIEVSLQAGFSCTGKVLAASGLPAPRADVSVGSRGLLGFTATRSGADGSFRLEGLAAGEVEVRAFHDNVRAAATVRGGPGATVSCTLQLVAGVELRGQVRCSADRPVTDAYVLAHTDAGSAGRWSGFAQTDADGRFVVRGCPEGRTLTIQVGARGHRDAVLLHVDPRAGEVAVRLEAAPAASVWIRGRITGPDGRPVPQAAVQADERRGGRSSVEAAADAGSFALGPLVPGRWRVCVQVPGSPWLWTDWRDLAADAAWDLGEVRLPVPGTLVIRPQVPPGLPVRFVVLDATLAVGNWGAVDDEGGRLRSKPLVPGRHYVLAVGEGVAQRLVSAEVRAGEETLVDVAVQRGLRRRFEVRCEQPLTELHLRFLQGRDLVLGSSVVGRTPDALRTQVRWLAPGDYVVTARGDGWSGETRFTVREGGDELVRIDLR